MHHLSGHPHVVTFKGAYEDASHVHIVMELCTGGELFEHIAAKVCAGGRAARARGRSACAAPAASCWRVGARTTPPPRPPPQGHYRERDAAHLMRNIVMVVEHCHQMDVVHRDLKVAAGRRGACVRVPVAWPACVCCRRAPPALHTRPARPPPPAACTCPQPENFLFREAGRRHIKAIDFGLSSFFQARGPRGRCRAAGVRLHRLA